MPGPDLDLEQRLGALRELLRSLFDGDQLRRFLPTLPGGDRLADELPGTSASFAALYHETAVLLHRWRLVDGELFNGLVRARPTARAEVERVAAIWEMAVTTQARARGAPSLVGADEATRQATDELRELRQRLAVLRSRGLPTGDLEETLRQRTIALNAGPQLRAGDLLAAGRYLLVERLGEGGFGTVWRAWDEQREQQVAIKVLHGEMARHPDRVERFERGARLMAQLKHPHIARVYEPARLESGHHYTVMELLPGGDLHARVLTGTLSRDAALAAVLDIGGALQFAHEHGVVHRDVKPHNILLDEGGGARLIDFDLGRAEDGTRNTRTQSSMGTLLYAAPEALGDARHVGPAGDVASLAMTVAFCVHGAELPPNSLYQRDRFLAKLACSEAIREVIVRGSAHEPQDRYPSAAAFCEALRAAMAGETAVAVAPPVQAPPPAAQPRAKGIAGTWVPPAQVAQVPPTPVVAPPPIAQPAPPAPALRPPLSAAPAAPPIAAPSPAPAPSPPPFVPLEVASATNSRRLRLMLAGLVGAGLLCAGGIAGIVSFLRDDEAPVEAPTPTPVEAPESSDETPVVAPNSAEAAPAAPTVVAAAPETVAAAPSTTTARQPEPEPEPPTHRANRWITIPAGEGVIGNDNGRDDEKPRWRVRWTEAYAMQETEVTKAQYMTKNTRSTYAADKADHPVVQVTWSQARTYCRAIGGRLPTEAEWEYAARAGSSTAYSFGDSASRLGDYAWYAGNSSGETHAVAKKKPNPWGLYDMHGNVREWVEDVYKDDRWQQIDQLLWVDPSPFVDGDNVSSRVHRGGSFGEVPPERLRSSGRGRDYPLNLSLDSGFRCVRGPDRQP